MKTIFWRYEFNDLEMSFDIVGPLLPSLPDDREGMERPIAHFLNEEDAALIVRAVNSYEAYQAAASALKLIHPSHAPVTNPCSACAALAAVEAAEKA